MARNKEKTQPIIVLFEDDTTARKERCERIEAALPSGIRVVPYADEALPRDQDKAIEYRLAESLTALSQNFNSKIGLIVCDRALDRYKEFQAASETVVSAAARTLGIPICLYERAAKSYGITLEQRRPWEKGEIIIDGDKASFGQECAALYIGFKDINTRLAQLSITSFQKMTPAEVLAFILERPEETDRIALYGAGEQGLLEDLLQFLKPSQTPDIKNLKTQHYPRVLGNWLFSSILRFPGILVNQVAAASMLNINPDDLIKKAAVRKLFAAAEYHGPFANDACAWHWWWRRELDAIVSKAGIASGLELAKRKGLRGLRSCMCCEGEDHPAGCVCMLSQKPVCEKHSRGGISWFPGGADLARVNTSVYNKFGPFLGLY